MSFVDLATLTLHRRHELENRIHIFHEKCDKSINDIKNLKMKANGFVSELNCDPSELKERFLNVMQKLDEYIYLITDLNLALAQTADTGSLDNTPVQDFANMPPSLSPFNLIDALTEPLPSSSHECPNLCPTQKPPRARTSKDQQKLIVFSSSSSGESFSRNSDEFQCQMPENMASLSIDVSEPVTPSPLMTEYNHKECCITAAQPMLEVDDEYPATIICADNYSLWVIIEDPLKVASFMSDMTNFYEKNKEDLSPSDLVDMTYCAYYEQGCYYRAMLLQKPEGEVDAVNVYVVDTGEVRTATVESIQPLVKQFCDRPPYARLCHLAGLDLGEHLNNKSLMTSQDVFMKKHIGIQCKILVDDNSSESLGVYVILPSTPITLNERMVNEGLAIPIEPFHVSQEERGNTNTPTLENTHGPPPEASDDEWNITQCPEYEDPVVAVTGYHNRDEADICKHYKGGPEKTCFKGSRCTKKHILHHPDGWTLDKVEVIAKCNTASLPAPGTWHKVLVTAVCHFDRIFVQFIEDTEEDDVPVFGVILPPMTLKSLHRDMNSSATIQAYKPLTIAPAMGELVAALYIPDNCWYRAKVLTVTRPDQCVEVMYIDYGTVLWVKEDCIRELEPRFTRLPLQGVQCALAGVKTVPQTSSELWVRAKRELTKLTQDKTFEAHIIAREYDEVILELYINDPEDPACGNSVAEILAERGLVGLVEFTVTNDDVKQKLVVP